MSIASGAMGQLFLVLSGVIAARLLGVEDRGHLALLALIPIIIGTLVSAGLPLAVTFEVARNTGQAGAIARAIAAPLALQSLGVVVVHAALLVALTRHAATPVRLAGAITLPVGPMLLVQMYGLALVQGGRFFRAFNALRLLPSFFYAGFLTFLWFAQPVGLVSVAVAWSLSVVLVGAVTTAIVFATVNLRAPGEAPDLRAMLRFGIRGLIGSSPPVETFRLDQAAVGLFLSPAALGLYVVALAFTNLPRIVAQSVGMVAFPAIASRRDSAERRRLALRFVGFSALATGTVVASLEVATPRLVPFFFGNPFRGAVVVAQILLVGAFLFGVRRVLSDAMQGLGDPAAGTIAELVSWGTLAPSLAILVPAWGLRGVAAALSCSAGMSVAALAVRFARPQWFSRVTHVRAARNGFTAAAFVGLSVGSGIAMALLPSAFVVGGVAFAALVLLAAGVRAAVRRQNLNSVGTVTALDGGEKTGESGALARGLYYGGLATIGLLSIRPALGLTISDWFFFSVLTTVLVGLGPRPLRGYNSPSLLIGVALFGLGATMSSIGTQSFSASLGAEMRFIYVTVVWFWLATVVLHRPRHVRNAITWWVVGASLSAAGAAAQLLSGANLPYTTATDGRFAGFTDHVNDLGGLTGIAIAPALVLVLASCRSRPVSSQILSFAALVVIVGGLVLSGSVGGMLAGASGVAVLVMLTGVKRRFLVVAAVMAAGFLFVSHEQNRKRLPDPLQRVAVVTAQSGQEQATFWSRLSDFRFAWDQVSKHPLIGAGLEARIEGPEGPQVVHNTLLGAWYSGGLAAFAGVIVVLVALASASVKTIVSAASESEGALATALCAALFSFVVFSMGAPLLYQRYAWAPAALLLALMAAQRSEGRYQAHRRREQLPAGWAPAAASTTGGAP